MFSAGDLEMASTKDAVDHHLKCFGERDLNGILFDFAPGAVPFTPDGPLTQADPIRPLFQAMIAEFGKPGATFSMKQQFVECDYGNQLLGQRNCLLIFPLLIQYCY
jgi:hypothetical protein